MEISRIAVRIFTVIFVLVFDLILLLIIAPSGSHLLQTNPQAIDFLAFYTGAKTYLNNPSALYDIPLQQNIQTSLVPINAKLHIFLPFLNPPVIALLFIPFTLVSLYNAYLSWLIVNSMLVSLLFIYIWKNLRKRKIWQFLIIILLFVTYLPLLTSLMIGQLSVILGCIVFFGYLFLRKGRLFIGGFILSLLFIKPQFLLLPSLAIILQKKPRLLFGFLTGLTSLFLISFIMVGHNGLYNYLSLLQQASSWYNIFGIDVSAQPTLQTALLVLTSQTSPEKIRVLWILCSILIAIPTFFVLKIRFQYNSIEFAFQYVLLFITTLIISPHTHFHDLVILAILALIISITNFKLQNYKKIATIIIFIGFLIPLIGYNLELYLINFIRPFWIIVQVTYLLIVWITLLKFFSVRTKSKVFDILSK